MADTFAPGNSVAVLREASWGATRSAETPVVLADAAVENVHAQVDGLIETGVLRRLLAFPGPGAKILEGRLRRGHGSRWHLRATDCVYRCRVSRKLRRGVRE